MRGVLRPLFFLPAAAVNEPCAPLDLEKVNTASRSPQADCYRFGPKRTHAGRIRVVNRCVETDGRRFAEWGNGKATAIHFAIALAWYFGASGDQLVQLYKKLYGDIR